MRHITGVADGGRPCTNGLLFTYFACAWQGRCECVKLWEEMCYAGVG